MYKTLYTLLLVAIISIQADAQKTASSLNHKLYPGTITKPGGEIIKGYVFNQGEENNQDKCIFYLDADDKQSKTEFKPADLTGYAIEDIQYKTINYSGNMPFGKASKHFVLLLKPGAVSQLEYFQGGGQPILQKGDEEPVSTSSMLLGFKKNIIKLVGDDKELADKIERKASGYGRLNVFTIIDEYNAWAASKK